MWVSLKYNKPKAILMSVLVLFSEIMCDTWIRLIASEWKKNINAQLRPISRKYFTCGTPFENAPRILKHTRGVMSRERKIR